MQANKIKKCLNVAAEKKNKSIKIKKKFFFFKNIKVYLKNINGKKKN